MKQDEICQQVEHENEQILGYYQQETCDKVFFSKQTQADIYINGDEALNTSNEYLDAIRCFDEEIKLNPQNYSAYFKKGLYLNELYKYQEAIKQFDEAIDLNPKESQIYTNKGRQFFTNLQVFPYNNFVNMKKPSNVLIRQSSQIQKINQLTLTKGFNQIQKQGFSLDELHQYEEAIKYFNEAIKLDSEDWTSYFNKGFALNELGKYEDAIKAYDMVIQLNPRNSSAYCNKGNQLHELGFYEDAIQCYNQAILLDPEDSSPNFNKGFTLNCLSKQKQAKKSYYQAIQLNPKDSKAYYQLSLCLHYFCNYKKAISFFEKALELDSQSREKILIKIDYLQLLELTLEKQKKYQQTKQYKN